MHQANVLYLSDRTSGQIPPPDQPPAVFATLPSGDSVVPPRGGGRRGKKNKEAGQKVSQQLVGTVSRVCLRAFFVGFLGAGGGGGGVQNS